MYTNKNVTNNDKKYCAITEQGDLGLGAEVLNEQDQKTLNNKNKKDNKK